MAGSDGGRGAFARKSVAQLQRDEATHGLKRSLGPVGLVFLGIGCTVGAGIYVLPGNVAANFAGPAILLSFVIAGLACSMTALCYAELASTLPAGGSAYTYCYASMGQGFAFLIGWLLVFEFGVAASTLAVGFAGYCTSLLRDFGIAVPASLARSLVQSSRHGTELTVTSNINLVASTAALVATFLLTRGVSELSRVNTILVAIKLCVLALFLFVGLSAIQPQNWTPFIPANEGGFHYGVEGVFRGASILFFAYLGFEVVAYAASESRNPQRDLPIGILGSLTVCTLIYMLVAAVLTGVVPYPELGVPDPLALVVDRMGEPQLAILVKVGALVGISSVLLINGYGQSRLAFTMSRDGLLPSFFARLHVGLRTPAQGIVVLGVITAIASATLPLSILNDLVSVGTAFAFSIVALSLMWLRSTQPELHRPFRVPLGGVRIGRVWIGPVPVAAIICSWLMILPAAIDIVRQARDGHVLPLAILVVYMTAGFALYTRSTRKLAPVALALLLLPCTAIAADPYPSTYQPLPRTDTLIRGATIFDGTGKRLEKTDLLLRDGKVAAIGSNLAAAGATVIDGAGKFVTPGLIDIHSHDGSAPAPLTKLGADVGEETDPNSANVWIEHAINPQDAGFWSALSGGVTVMQILPGSGNLFGGRAVVLKNVPATTAQQMKFPGAPQGLKMACGENPKAAWGGKGRFPSSRMGIVAGWREAFQRAAEYARKPEPPVRDFKLDTLAGVLRGEIKVNIHCYRADEIATVLDLAREFGFKVTAFHHAIEAYKIPQLLVREGTCAVVWPDWWGFKGEAYDGIRENAAFVDAAGGCVALHSDTRIAQSRLNIEVAKAAAAGRRAGLTIALEHAIQWITRNPAVMLGIADQTGTIEIGKNADVVVWTGDPFSVYSLAERVFVDGALVYDRTDPARQPVADVLAGQTVLQ